MVRPFEPVGSQGSDQHLRCRDNVVPRGPDEGALVAIGVSEFNDSLITFVTGI